MKYGELLGFSSLKLQAEDIGSNRREKYRPTSGWSRLVLRLGGNTGGFLKIA
jgi:hypothetical protein